MKTLEHPDITVISEGAVVATPLRPVHGGGLGYLHDRWLKLVAVLREREPGDDTV